MKQFVSLKKSSDFGEVYQQGKSYGNRLLVMYVLEKSQDHVGRVGISVSKKVGNSVVRHRIKRLIREAFRRNLLCWNANCDYVVVVRKDAKDKDYHEIESALMHLGRRQGVLNVKGDEI